MQWCIIEIVKEKDAFKNEYAEPVIMMINLWTSVHRLNIKNEKYRYTQVKYD